jgi:hypothetical protein
MYIQYAKDSYSGRILGVVVATATNQVGFALASPYGDITRIVKDDLVTVAIARSYTHTVKENLDLLYDFLNRNLSTSKFYDKVSFIKDIFQNMCWKAANSTSLPTMVYNKELM